MQGCTEVAVLNPAGCASRQITDRGSWGPRQGNGLVRDITALQQFAEVHGLRPSAPSTGFTEYCAWLARAGAMFSAAHDWSSLPSRGSPVELEVHLFTRLLSCVLCGEAFRHFAISNGEVREAVAVGVLPVFSRLCDTIREIFDIPGAYPVTIVASILTSIIPIYPQYNTIVVSMLFSTIQYLYSSFHLIFHYPYIPLKPKP